MMSCRNGVVSTALFYMTVSWRVVSSALFYKTVSCRVVSTALFHMTVLCCVVSCLPPCSTWRCRVCRLVLHDGAFLLVFELIFRWFRPSSPHFCLLESWLQRLFLLGVETSLVDQFQDRGLCHFFADLGWFHFGRHFIQFFFLFIKTEKFGERVCV